MSERVLSCPRCSTSLERVIRVGVEVDRCDECEGIWLDPGEGEPVTRPGAEVGDPIRSVSDRVRAIQAQEIACPRCGEAMRRERYDKSLVTIDRCTCGVWLDGGEVAKIQRYRSSRLDQIEASEGPERRAELEQAFARLYFDVGRA